MKLSILNGIAACVISAVVVSALSLALALPTTEAPGGVVLAQAQQQPAAGLTPAGPAASSVTR